MIGFVERRAIRERFIPFLSFVDHSRFRDFVLSFSQEEEKQSFFKDDKAKLQES